MRRIVTAVALAALVAAGAADAAKPKAKTRTVHVGSDYYDPAKLTIDVGDKVVWRWKGTGFSPHDVAVDSGPETFASPTQYTGTFAHRFKKAGTYLLYCTQHDMTQTVVVRKKRKARG